MKKRQVIVVTSFSAIVVFSYLLMRFLIAQKEELPRRPPEIGERWVKTETVLYKTIESKVLAKGRVVSTAEVEVIAEAAGKIEPGSVSLKKGGAFSKGDTLLTIYKDEVELALKAQKSRFLNAIANLLPDIKIDFPEKYDAFTKFFNSIDLDSDFPQLPEIKTEKMKIFLASRDVLDDYYSIKKAEKQLSRHTIIAPFKGTFTDVFSQVGAFTNMGGRIARIIHTDELEVEVPVLNNQSEFIRLGNRVKLSSSDRGETWDGRVVRVSDFIDISTQRRSIFVNVSLSNQAQLYAGEYLEAEFSGMEIANAMEIPISAVDNSNEVFIVNDGRLKKREVEIIKRNEETVIFRGLQEGIEVVVQALINVDENTKVKIIGKDKPTEIRPMEG